MIYLMLATPSPNWKVAKAVSIFAHNRISESRQSAWYLVGVQ